jgi:ligand-binding sensor domain-containing protein
MIGAARSGAGRTGAGRTGAGRTGAAKLRAALVCATMLGVGTLAAGLPARVLAAAPIEVHTATRDVRDCLALDAPGLAGATLAATDGGLVLVDASGRALETLTRLDGLPDTRSYTIAPVLGSSQAWWVGTEGGLARVERRGDRLEVRGRWAAAPVRAVLEHEGRVWLGTWGAGVLELRGDALAAVAGPSLADADRVTAFAVFEDRVVVASAGAGAWVLGERPDSLAGLDGLDTIVWSLAVLDGTLYAGTFTGVQALAPGERVRTVSSVDARALAAVPAVSPNERGILRVASRGQGLVDLGRSGAAVPPGPRLTHAQGLDRDRCVATPEGLWIRGEGSARASETWNLALVDGLPAGDITATLAHADAVWVGTFEHGLAVARAGRWQVLADPQLGTQVNALAPADGGRVWVATTRGLHRVGLDLTQAGAKLEVETWTAKQGLPHANILSLAPLATGELLIGTHAGVAILDTQGQLRPLGRKARSWATWAVAEGRDGTLWLGTTQGLIRWRSDGTWEPLSMLSGQLADNWVTALLVDGDTVHIGTYAGGVTSLRKHGRAGWAATQLGGGRVNPGGLALVDGQLAAATMKGALIREGDRWRPLAEATFEDVTAIVPIGSQVWIASRRGLAVHERAR